jgi:UDP-N-acetylglucosamine 2-epimerase
MKIVSIVGTRPQFLKLAFLSKRLKEHNCFEHIVIHTGQHYDARMSDNIFKKLCIDMPYINLNINKMSPIIELGNMIIKISENLEIINPDVVKIKWELN